MKFETVEYRMLNFILSAEPRSEFQIFKWFFG